MTRSLRWCLPVGLAGCLAAGSLSATPAQSAFALTDLTVPARGLPAGCVLEPVSLEPAALEPQFGNQRERTADSPVFDSRTTVVAARPAAALGTPRFPSNPWSGTDYALRRAVRNAIDGAPLSHLPDAPPLSVRERNAMAATWVEPVVEAYRAVYRAGDDGQVQVSAVRFSDPGQVLPPPMRSLSSSAPPALRIVRDATVIAIAATADSDCLRSIEQHLRSIK